MTLSIKVQAKSACRPMNSGSITHWIERVKTGSESVAEKELWDRYFLRLAALARRKLDDLPPQVRDDEDVALSALNTFFTRAKDDNFPQLHDRRDLWQLLTKITVRKTADLRRNTLAQKRGFGQLLDDSLNDEYFKNLAGNEPTPDMVAAINEECCRLMEVLEPSLQTVARMKLEGYTNREIAKSIGRVERTVDRKLDCIRQIWSKGVELQ
ncbi:ECF-type sigma factor [Bythopirellula polymerisocia]|uniref:ECF-type sigma factor n=1 Tax=Bythopirellula polymerisocia TaxID=2528003 RepID=UPI0018D334E8|nr:ECF-type sigma factor [Bythopirellula polymerisocia]